MQRRITVASSGLDPRRAIIGTSPAPGDAGYLGIVLPATPTLTRMNRMLVRLCAITIQEGMVGRILSMGQLLTIAACVPGQEEGRVAPRTSPCDSPSFLVERQVETPFWSFPDGNVSWHLHVFQDRRQPDLPYNPGVATYDNNPRGQGPAILTDIFPPGALRATGAAMPTGRAAVPPWHSMDYPWPGRTFDFAEELEFPGPCTIGMFATVWQTDPVNRVVPSAGININQLAVDAGLVPEDKFLVAFPDTARYYRIGGRMVVETRCNERKAE